MTDRDPPPPTGEPAPGSAEAHRQRGIAFFRQRRFIEAAGEFRAWAAASTDPHASLALGRALWMAGDRTGAEAAWQHAVERDPKLVRAHLLRSRAAASAGRLGLAGFHLRQAIQAEPNSAILRAMLARLLLRQLRLPAARRFARAALGLDPGCDMAQLVVAQVRLADGELVEAQQILDRLAERRPDWPELRALMQRLDSDASPARKDPSFPEGAGRRTGGTMRTGPASWPREPTSAGAAAAGPALAIAGINSAALFPNTDFLDQIFLLRALILRHLRLLYRDTRFGFLIEYVRPSIVIAFHYVLFTWLKRPMPAKIPTELFIIGSFTIWFSATHVMHAAPSADRQAAGFPGVTSVHLLLARTLWEYLSMLSFAMFCVILLKIIGLREPIPDLSLSALYFLLAATIGLGLALILLALGRVSAVTSTLDKNLYWILFVTTGHYFSIATVQPVIANIVWYNPLLHLVELQRHALYPGYPTALVSYWYPAVVAAGLVIFGLILEKCTRHRVHR